MIRRTRPLQASAERLRSRRFWWALLTWGVAFGAFAKLVDLSMGIRRAFGELDGIREQTAYRPTISRSTCCA